MKRKPKTKIPKEDDIFKKSLTKKQRLEIDKAVKKMVKEYGETLRMLGKS